MNKFTPGPWQQVSRNINDLERTFHGVRAGSFYFDIPTSCELSDARLIAAAPDLLEALEDAVADYDAWMKDADVTPNEYLQAWTAKARTAISRARGEE